MYWIYWCIDVYYYIAVWLRWCIIPSPNCYVVDLLGEEDLSVNFGVDGKIGFVVDALYTAARGLDKMFRTLCPNATVSILNVALTNYSNYEEINPNIYYSIIALAQISTTFNHNV